MYGAGLGWVRLIPILAHTHLRLIFITHSCFKWAGFSEFEMGTNFVIPRYGFIDLL